MEDEINLLDYWFILVKRWKVIVLIALFCFAFSVFYSIRQPVIYKASVTIMPVETGGGGLASAIAAFPILGVAAGTEGEARLAPILKSASLAKSVAWKIDLKEDFPEVYGNSTLNDDEKIQIIAGALRGGIKVKSDGALINVSMEWRDPKQAAQFANLYVKQLAVFLNQRSLNINFQVIDPAIAPTSKYKPKTKRNAMVGLVFGLLLGLFCSFLIEIIHFPPSVNR